MEWQFSICEKNGRNENDALVICEKIGEKQSERNNYVFKITFCIFGKHDFRISQTETH